ncbi:hypothetical protein BJ085DRAFT_30432 [Dimargaris cristalligena]|uniref:Uncharacterized protein n=1 Tax=Dimargaris cristalligena TaxID=215637 RepID=A0A4P9ZZ06_9FUNG|nr:hypothetical protein BJ085DRAFT_30432 [Dimargaris cristalligena]|eukprot:RKP38933.1 hypothetical protein BJ085DRAFT_30432 [Dimargaris cristalligena]
MDHEFMSYHYFSYVTGVAQTTGLTDGPATLSGLYVYYFGAALRYPAPVRKLLREALIYHKHASTLDYERAIHAYEQALAVLADTPGFPPADDHVTGILVELADVLDRAKRWAEAAAVDKDLLERWVGQQGMEDPVLVGRRLAAGAIEGHQSPGNSSVVRETIMKALGTSHHLADMYSKVYKSSHSDEVPDSNIVGDSDSDALLRGRERALEWSVQVVMVALGLFHSPAPKESQSSTTPPPDTSAQPSTDSSSSSSPSNIFAGLPVVPMDANRLPPWITYQEVGGCLEALALYYANEGHRPQIALAMYSSLIELIGDRDPCHASVLMTHCAQILADHAHNLPRAKHWLDHALSVATQFQHNNPECADNCTAAWYSYGILEERVGNSSGALKQFKKAHYNAKQKGQLETQGLAQQAIDRLVAADPNR